MDLIIIIIAVDRKEFNLFSFIGNERSQDSGAEKYIETALETGCRTSASQSQRKDPRTFRTTTAGFTSVARSPINIISIDTAISPITRNTLVLSTVNKDRRLTNQSFDDVTCFGLSLNATNNRRFVRARRKRNRYRSCLEGLITRCREAEETINTKR